MFEDLIPQSAGDNPFADLQPGAMLRGEKPVDGGFFAAAKQSGGSLLKGAGQFAADFIPGVSDDNGLKRYGQEVIDANPTAVQSLSDIADKPLTAIKEATGNTAGSMAGIVGSRLVGQGITAAAPLAGPAAPVVAAVGQGISLLGPYAVAAVPSFGSIREKQQSDTPQDKAIAALGAGTVGLIENKFGPQEWALSAMTKAGRDQLAEKFAAKTLTGSIAKGIGTGAAVEGGEELVQNPIEQLASYQDPRTPENLADTAFGGVMGAIGGGVVGGPMAGLAHRQPQPVAVPRQDGQGEALIDPATGPLSAAAADHVTRTQTDQDLFADMMPAAPVDSAIEPQQVSGSMFDDLIPADEPISPLLSWQQETDPVSLEEAQAVVQQARDAGYDGHAVIRHGNGFTAVPKEWLNTDQVKAAELLQPAPAKDLFADLPTTIDQPASQANTAPTEAQIAAGNYQKGHIKVGSLDIAIENPVGSTRTGPGWQTTMQAHYGYLKRTKGADGDQVDVYVKQGTPTDHTGPVFVIDQFDPATGKFDEHKAMVGYRFQGAAIKAYDQHFSDGSGPSRRRTVTKMTAEQFKDWAQNGDTRAPAGTPKGWEGFQAGDRVTTKAGTTGTLSFDETGTIARVTPDVLDDGSQNTAGRGVFSVTPGEVSKASASQPAPIEDFGEKIGGARKDLAQPTGPKAKAAPIPAETEPGWQRRFQPLQNMLRSDETWNLFDTKTGKPVRGAEFKSEQAAKDAIPLIAVAQKHRVVAVKDGFEIMRDVTDRKRVKVVDQVFPTRDAAMTYMSQHAQAIIETKTSFREELFARPEKVMRNGQPRRTGHATAEDFAKTFAFRGVEFGLWNNQDERQEVMNHAFDGLLDLAEVLGVPPKALSLNGDLALAFGARGQGLSGAIAHYERGHAVINLTKMQGAGALAHEWFHAADHYFGRQDGKASSEKIQNKRGDTVFDTDGTGDYASHGLSLKSIMREELQAKYKALIQTLFTKAEQYVEDTEKAERFVGSTRDTLVKSLTAMRKQLEKAPEWQKRNNKPASAEQLAEFDRLADDLVAGRAFQLETRSSEPKKGQRFGNIRLSNDQLDALSALFKAVRGRNGMNAEGTGIVDGIRSDLRRYAERVRMLEEARNGNEKTKRVPTEFAMNAKRIDQGSATDYWTTPHEMAARAFSAYVEDKLPGRSDFLSYGSDNAMPQYRLFGVRPFPEGAERVAIGKAFDDFVGALQTRETEKGIELYNQPAAAKPSSGFDQYLFSVASQGDAKTILNAIAQVSDNTFNRELAKLLMAQNLATTIQTAAFDGQHSGGYNPQTDVITIMQATDAEQTILHELMHASTVRALSNKSVAAGAMRSLLKEVRQHLGLDSHYGLTDVREFVAEAFTNPEFQEALRQIPVKASGIRGKIADAWGRFVATVRQLLGLERDSETALGKALELGARLMQENQTAPLRGYTGEVIGNQAKPTRHLIGQATNQLHDLFANSGGTFNWLHKTVGTQYHKAQIDRHFAKVFGLGQQYLLDTSRFAMDAADKAPSLLMKLESLRDIFSAKAAKRSDVEAIADPLFAGTLENMVWSNAELRDRFGLNATQIKLFREARAAVGKSLDDLGISEMAQVAKAVLPGIDLERVKGAELVTARDYLHSTLNREADIQRLNGQEDTAKALESAATDVLQKAKHIVDLKADGYVPMMRFGKFAVDVVGADGGRLFFGMYETRREANQAARALQVAYPAAEVTQGQLDTETWRLFQGLDPSSLEVFAKALGAEEKAIYQDFLKLTINNRSAMKRLLAQKGTEGYSRDVQRILASFVTSNARLAAKNYHFGDLKQAVLDIPKVKGDVRNEAAKLVEYLQNPQEEAAGLRGYLFVHFLGGSVASALVNMTQPLTMTAPYLSQFGNAATALAKAGKLLASGRYDAELRDAMQLAEREGITAPHELHQLYAESMQTLGRNALVRRGLHAWGSFFSLAEQFNRKLTFIAAFEMARQNGEANPFAFAEKAVVETQGLYNKANRPNWARGPIGATVFTFKQFSIAYVEFLRRLWKSDKRAFAIAMAVLFVGAGAEGWPFAEDLEDLIDTVGQFAGFGINSKAWARENATKVFGELGGEIFRKGISALLPIDLSSRLGVQNLIPGSAMFKVSETDKTRDMLEFVGPFGGFVSAALKGFDAARMGDLAGAATMAAPVAIQNALKGQDMQAFGFYRDTKGRRVVDTDGYDAFAKAIGFQPNVVARESGKIREQQQNVAQQRAVETEIADLWAHGVFERDEAKVKDAVSRLKAWNERNPEMPIRIAPRQIGERVKAMAMSREQRFAKSVPREMRGMLQ